ncbi:hypothetical protein SAMN05660642_03301 [Geodermatophilus siccatus]|uniref:Uncharacterized protein n=1 Tax=Geodermatophilus siccatus TaxID=1137991 RepID=A0A1G9VXK8_9ACTN|nr:hypothetical protein [Geodermatophilus siccatus]SDM77038.1 hypothetical protein SAMN05660642_03301 [Geodermatophilus siccatus]
MRTYDPADSITYVHLAPRPAAAAATSPHAHDECHRLPAGYANASLRARLGGRHLVSLRPALAVLPGGSAAATGSAPAAPALRLVQ